MKVKMLKTKSEVIDSLTTKNWPAGWSGDVPDEVVSRWQRDADYAEIGATDAALPPAVVFTPAEAAVLKSAAKQALETEALADEAAGEPVVEPDPDASEVDLNTLSIQDLRAAARSLGIKGAQTMSKAALVAALQVRRL